MSLNVLRRAWLIRGPGWILPIVMLVALLVAAVVVLTGLPVGPVIIVAGRVEDVRYFSTSYKVKEGAVVIVDGVSMRVPLPTMRCRKGDNIVLERQARLLGGRVYRASGPRPCIPPDPGSRRLSASSDRTSGG